VEETIMAGESLQEFWRWPESRWKNPELDWKKAKIVSCGIDVGSVSTQAVIMVDDEIYCYGSMRTGSSSPDSATKVFAYATEETGITLKDVSYTVGTGYGRVNVPFGNRAITEIACHARGANRMYGPTVRTILDMGGQDCKAIKTDDKGKVVAFLMNDKCAAGTGRGMEVFADLLEVSVQDMGDLSLKVDEEPPPVNATCVVFAKSEAVGLLRAGWTKEKVLAAYCSAMAHRVSLLLEKINVEKDFAITGGIAKNPGIVKRLEKELGLDALKPDFDTQIAGAVGAALFAKSLFEKGGR
jgi:bzd-type benzoyl-CoA reductase Q subunit